MHKKFISTITAGAVIGVVASLMLIPNMDKSIKERAKKTGEMAEGMYESMKDHIL